MTIRIIVILIFLGIQVQAQSEVVTDFVKNHDTSLSLYFYPSTLRMININRNPEFDEMIRKVKKARFYRLDESAVGGEDLKLFSQSMDDHGFEELMMVQGKDMNIRIWGNDDRVPKIITLAKTEDGISIIEVDGVINIAKIPKLAEAFSQNQFLDVLQLNKQNN